jgi:uncharacterized protein YukE
MTRVIFDPEQMMGFVAHLRSTRETLRTQQAQLEAGWASLGEVWRDARFREFHSSLTNAIRVINIYYQQSEELERYLSDKARRGQEYLYGR